MSAEGKKKVKANNTTVQQRGFTLLEVMVALAIVSVALATLVKAARANASNAAYLRDKTFAQWVAVNKVTELRVSKTWPAIGEKKGHTLMGNNDWFWLAKVKKTEVPGIRTIEYKVYRSEQERIDNSLPVYRMTAFIGKPL